ncbi:hypothetical protein BH20ACT2_BH20ACT2_06170 [soil metagenome]
MPGGVVPGPPPVVEIPEPVVAPPEPTAPVPDEVTTAPAAGARTQPGDSFGEQVASAALADPEPGPDDPA